MAQTFYTAENLGIPFRYLRELAMVVSPTGNRVTSTGRKLVLVLGGKCRHHFEGGRAVTLEPGDVLVVASPTQQFYELLPQEDSTRLHALVILLDARYFPPNGRILASLEPEHREAIQFIATHFNENIHLKNVMDARLFEMTAQIRDEAELQLPGFRWRITALCASGMVQLARKMRSGEQAATQASQGSQPSQPSPASQLAPNRRGVFLVSRAKEYLLKHLTHEITLSAVAAHLQVSTGHLAHTFKRVAGQSLFTYFRQLRLEQAKLQLLNSEKNVTQIAAACGFSSTTLFCRNFKQYTGHTPLGYRDEFMANSE